MKDLKEMSGEELLNFVDDGDNQDIFTLLHSKLKAGEEAIADRENLKCCGNCIKYQSGTPCVEYNFWNKYCSQWQPDNFTRQQRKA